MAFHARPRPNQNAASIFILRGVRRRAKGLCRNRSVSDGIVVDVGYGSGVAVGSGVGVVVGVAVAVGEGSDVAVAVGSEVGAG